MTDEKLIEEAARAILEAWKQRGSALPDENLRWEFKEDARVALSVFEKALGEATVTPTDADEVISEQEALRIAELDARQEAYRQDCTDWFVDHEQEPGITTNAFFRGWDAAVDGGFRRNEIPEPSAEATHRGTFGHVWPCPLFYVGNWKRGDEEYSPAAECSNAAVCERPEPQGEPSDAQNWNCGKCDREEALGRDDGQIPSHHRSCQADVKLLAAANAYMRYQPPYDDLSAFSPQFRADMRAALRASWEVR